jgi:hypothetical protein
LHFANAEKGPGKENWQLGRPRSDRESTLSSTPTVVLRTVEAGFMPVI